MRRASIPLSAALLLSLAGCSVSSVQVVPMPEQRLPLTDPRLCRIYLFREDLTVVNHQAVRVELDGRLIGTLGTGRFLCVEVRPGLRQLRTTLQVTSRRERSDIETLKCVAGRVLHCRILFPFEQNRRPRVVVLDPGAGRMALEELDPAPVTP